MNIFIIILFFFAYNSYAILDIPKIIKHINVYRELHQAPPLEYSNSISEFSQSWANHMASKQLFEHSSDWTYGENIAMSYNIQDQTYVVIDAINRFYDEETLYDYKKPGFYKETGHFTQLVWINSKQIGIGIAISSSNYVYVCTNYYPPGNYENEFENNVKPKILAIYPSPRKMFLPPYKPVSPPPPMEPVSPRKLLPPPPMEPVLPRKLLPPPPKEPVSPRKLLPPPPKEPVSPRKLLPFSYLEPVPPRKLMPSPPFEPVNSTLSLNDNFSISIKYPGSNQSYVTKILCPSLNKYFNTSKCYTQLQSTTGIYYGMNLNISYHEIRSYIAFDLDNFTRQCNIACESTIGLYLNNNDIFRYKASLKTCKI